MAALMRALLLGGLLSVTLTACMGASAPKERLSTLKVKAQPANTVVYVNGRFAGRAVSLQKVGKALLPGVQYVTFQAPGYFPHDVRLDLPPGETEVELSLRPIPQ